MNEISLKTNYSAQVKQITNFANFHKAKLTWTETKATIQISRRKIEILFSFNEPMMYITAPLLDIRVYGGADLRRILKLYKEATDATEKILAISTDNYVI